MKRLALPVLLAAFVALGAAYAVVTPLFEISDELWHYPMVKRLADGQGLPVQDPANVGPWRQEGSQPPLYYLLMAAASAWIDTRDLGQVRWINPHTDNGLITADRNNNIVIHRADEIGRWTGTALAVRVIRLLSVLVGVGAVYFTYRLAEEVLPGRPGLALAAASITAFTPMFIFISASVNNDTLAVTLSAATLWLLARWLRRPPGRLGWEHLALGALLGAGALSKQSALGLWGLAAGVVAWVNLFPGGWGSDAGRPTVDGRRPTTDGRPQTTVVHRLPWAPPAPQAPDRVSSVAVQALVVFGVAALIAGWWYWRNVQLYGDWLGWNTFVAIVGARSQPATLFQLWGERVGFVQAYWGLFGGVSVPMPDWVYLVLNLAVGLALIGLGWGAGRAVSAHRISLLDLTLWGLVTGWIVLIVVGLIRWTSITWASQGRLIFPAISAISLLIAAGLDRLWRGLPWALAGFMALLAAAVPFVVIAPHYAPPPDLTPAQLSAIPQRADVDFGGELRLLGYEVQTETALPGGTIRLTLYWQALIAMDRNWSLYVHVVDEQGLIIAQRDRYPGQGLLATTLLRPGQTFADGYVIALPAGAFSPVTAHIEVGVYDLADGTRLATAAGDEAFAFGSISVPAREAATALGPVPNALRQDFGGLIELTGYAVDRRVLRAGEALRLTLYWRALAPIQTNYSVSARVRGPDNTRWAARDSWPQDGGAPTSTWTPGGAIADPYTLTLAADTPPGQYDLEVVIYDSETLTPLRLWAADGRPTDAGSVVLSPVRVTP